MEYQVTVIETYWVTASDAKQAEAIVRKGKIKPEETTIEVNG